MSAGRKPNKTEAIPMVEPVPDQGTVGDALALMREQVRAEEAQRLEEVLSAGMGLGAMNAADFFATVADSVKLSCFENVKKSKAWKHLTNCDGRKYESIDEFCAHRLGKSYRRLQEISANTRLLGQEVYEQAEKLGLRQVDYNAIKALPAPEQELVRRAVEEAATKEQVLDTLQELAGRFATQKQQLEKALDEERAEHGATKSVSAKKSEQITELQVKNRRIQVATPDEAQAELLKEAAEHTADALGALRGGVRAALQALADHYITHGGEPLTVAMAGMLGQLQAELTAIRRQFNLPDVADAEVPEWIKAAEEEEATHRPSAPAANQ